MEISAEKEIFRRAIKLLEQPHVLTTGCWGKYKDGHDIVFPWHVLYRDSAKQVECMCPVMALYVAAGLKYVNKEVAMDIVEKCRVHLNGVAHTRYIRDFSGTKHYFSDATQYVDHKGRRSKDIIRLMRTAEARCP